MYKNIIKILSMLVFSSVVFAGDFNFDNYESSNVTDGKYFFGGYLGLSRIDVEKNNINGSISVTRIPDTNGMHIGGEIGYRYNTKTFSTLSYTKAIFDDVDFDNMLFTINRKFFEDYPELYLGLVGGISYMEDKKKHIAGSITDTYGSKSPAYGAQIGYEDDLKKDGYSWFVRFRYLKAKHRTNLIYFSIKSEHIRDHQTHISLGIRYNFRDK